MTDEIDEVKVAALLERTRQLPKEIEPPGDAWPAIRAEIEKFSITPVAAVAPHSISFWHKPAFLAAAALFLVVTSSLITARMAGHRDRSIQQSAAATPANLRESAPGPATMAEFAAVETDYISTANQLTAILEADKTTLSPETVAKLRTSLGIIDEAIVEARRALASDPANRALIDLLNTTYGQKLDLLRRTTEMGRS